MILDKRLHEPPALGIIANDVVGKVIDQLYPIRVATIQQDGEHVEPFRISIFEFRVYTKYASRLS